MKIIKRDGSEQPFNKEKIIKAITKANNECLQKMNDNINKRGCLVPGFPLLYLLFRFSLKLLNTYIIIITKIQYIKLPTYTMLVWLSW